MARPIIGRALLEIEHAQQPDDQEHGGRDAEHGVGDKQPQRIRTRDLLADQHELDRDRRYQRKCHQVMQKCEQRGHDASPSAASYSWQNPEHNGRFGTNTTPPTVWIFFVSVVLAVLAVLVTYGHVSLFRSSYAFLVLLIAYVVLAIGCLFRRV